MRIIASQAKGSFWKSLKLATGILIAGLAAMDCALAAPPGTVTLNTPANGAQLANSSGLEFSWTEETQTASWYYIWVNRNGAAYAAQWVNATVWDPAQSFAGGNYTWWVRAWNRDGFGPWSGTGSFSIAVNTPGQITLVSPLGTTTADFTMPYTWDQDANAAWYELYIMRDNGLFLDKWYSTSHLNSSGGQLSVDVPNHKSGSYRWWVRGWSPDGMGPWSSAGSFVINLGPGAANLLTPDEGSATDNFFPVLSWSDAQPAASWYQVALTYAGGTNGAGSYYTTWVPTNFWQPNSALAAGDYTWWVRGWNTEGLGIWSSAGHFTVPPITPGLIQQVFPQGTAYAGSSLNYRWVSDPFADWYHVQVVKDGQSFLDQWLSQDNLTYFGPSMYGFAVAGTGTGNYQWRIQGWNRYGLGPWTDYMSFSVPTVSGTLGIGGSQWTGVMSTYVARSSTSKYHVVTSLSLNGDGTFNESGTFERLVHQPYNDSFNDESYNGTYTISGNTVRGTSGDGTVSFSLNLNANHSQVVSGTWTDGWDGNQTYSINPNDLVRTQ